MGARPTADRGTRPASGRLRVGAADALLVAALRRAGGWMVTLAVANVALAASTLLAPAALAAALDAALGHGPPTALPVFGGVLALGVVATALAELSQPYAAARSTIWLRHLLVGRLLALGVAAQRRFATGDLVSRLGNNAGVAAAAGPVVLASALSLATSAGAVVALWLIDPLLAVVFLAGAPVGLVLSAVFVRRSSELYGRYQRLQGELAGRFVDAMAGVRTIRAAGTAAREVERVLAPVPELSRAGHGTWQLQGAVMLRMLLLAPLVEVGVLALAGWLLAADRLSPGEFLATAGYVVLGLAFFEQASILIALSRARAAARRVEEVLAEAVPPPTAVGAALPPGGGELVLRGVTVRDGATTLLDRLDLRLPAGAAIALVGASGAGKSVLAAVAGRLVEPDAGAVLLDGVDLAAVDARELRRAVGYAFERPQLLGDTVLDALGYGLDRPEPAHLVAAAVTAHADEFVRRLPDGYHTRLADAPLSGGEAQRLGLARAVARDSRLLIMDDATSSLDTVTEVQVGDALAAALAGRSRLIVAHRAGTAARADLVAWMQDDRIRAVAPHATLWRDPGYRAMFGAERRTARPVGVPVEVGR